MPSTFAFTHSTFSSVMARTGFSPISAPFCYQVLQGSSPDSNWNTEVHPVLVPISTPTGLGCAHFWHTLYVTIEFGTYHTPTQRLLGTLYSMGQLRYHHLK